VAQEKVRKTGGDLLIRDLGYFVLKVLGGIIEKKAFFISRLRYGITLYDEIGKEIGWKDLCKKKVSLTERY
jgi:hypothetical protein